MIAFKVSLKVVDQAHGFPEQFLVPAPVHQDRLGAEHLRHLRQDRGSAHGGQPVAEYADGRIRRNAAQSVRSAALETHGQLIRRAGHPFVSAHTLCQFLQQRHSGFLFILAFLADQEPDPACVIIPHIGFNLLDSAVFTAQPQQQHPARVGMGSQCCQCFPGIVLVVPQLAAAVGMRKGIHAFHRAAGQLLRFPGQGFCHVIHAADGRQNPQLIPDAGFSLFPGIAHKGYRFRFLLLRINGMPVIFLFAGQQCMQVLDMNMSSRRNICRRFSDGITVFDHGLPFPDFPQRRLMAHRQILLQGDLPGSVGYRFSGLQRFQRHRHHIRRMNANHLVHVFLHAKYRHETGSNNSESLILNSEFNDALCIVHYAFISGIHRMPSTRRPRGWFSESGPFPPQSRALQSDPVPTYRCWS